MQVVRRYKKICGLSRELKAKEKYQIIDQLKDKYSIRILARTLKCSKSGYYDWISLGRPIIKAFDKGINDLIMKHYSMHNEFGIRQIRMQIKRKDGRILTNSTIYRYMKLNGIESISRRKTHCYPKIDHHNIPNLLHRNFTTDNINKKWSIDISYIFAKDGLRYLCAIKDMYDKSIIAYKISEYLNIDFVLDTVNEAVKLVPYSERKELILHSDQGWHFTNFRYQELLRNNGIIQSISAKGSSVDNVPIESFFSALKTECIYKKNNLKAKEIDSIVKDYIEYYNNERYQEKLKELSPHEFRAIAQLSFLN